MCRGSNAILTLDRRRQTELRSETEQVMSTTGGMMITLVHQLERENSESYYNLPGTPVRERELEYQGDTSILLTVPPKMFQMFWTF